MEHKTKSVIEKFSLPDLITSLLYTSAVSTILSISINCNKNQEFNDFTVIFYTVVIVLLVFADWNNRVLIPIGFDKAENKSENKSENKKHLKLFLEVLSITTLVLFFNQFMKPNDKLSVLYFSLYLFFSWLWNFIIINEMKGITFSWLWKSIFTGKTINNNELKHYTKPFTKKIEKLEREIENEKQKLKEKEDEGSSHLAGILARSLNRELKRIKIKYSVYGLIGQFIANHLTWVNFFVGLFLLLSYCNIIPTGNYYIFEPYFSEIPYVNMIHLGTIFLISLLIIFIYAFDITKSNFMKILFSLLILLVLISIYITCKDFIILIMILQQVLVGYLLEKMTDGELKILT